MMRGDDSSVRAIVQQVAQATRELSNPVAWRKIEALLLAAGLTPRGATRMKTAVWEARRRLHRDTSGA